MHNKQEPRLPTFYISHGGGPCFWLDWGPINPFTNLASYFKGFADQLKTEYGRLPTAVLVISAHWEEDQFTIQTNPRPPMLFDYYGFPPETYKLNFPAQTDQNLIRRVKELFIEAKTPLLENSQRGYDHGVFVPLLLMFPLADIPVVQLSLKNNLSPAEHLKVGQILEPLRSENILIIGSGLSYHNLKYLHDSKGVSKDFDNWLQDTMSASSFDRTQRLINWTSAPNARLCHPREDHLIPLMVAAGAGTNDFSKRTYNEQMSNWKFWTSSFKIG